MEIGQHIKKESDQINDGTLYEIGPMIWRIPAEPVEAQIVWRLNDYYAHDPIISERLSGFVKDNDIERTVDCCNRDNSALAQIDLAIGRGAQLSTEPVELFETKYDTLEISGIGFTDLPEEQTTRSTAPDYSVPIEVPLDKNFSVTHPMISHLSPFEPNRGDRYLFTGAYTESGVSEKVANTLYIFEQLIKETSPEFVIPIPIAIGKYPHILDPDGNPAYFIVFKTPYKGNRTGKVGSLGAEGAKAEEIFERFNDIGSAAKALSVLHKKYGLSHYAPVCGNVYAKKGALPLIADFESVETFKGSVREINHEQASGLWTLTNSMNRLYARISNPIPTHRKVMEMQNAENCLSGYLSITPDEARHKLTKYLQNLGVGVEEVLLAEYNRLPKLKQNDRDQIKTNLARKRAEIFDLIKKMV